MTKRVAIIGSGIAGLTCAYQLKKNGYDVTVFEKERELHGRMGTYHQGPYHFNIGAALILDQYTHLMKLANELGVQDLIKTKQLNWQIQLGETLYPLRGGKFDFLTARFLPWGVRLRLTFELGLALLKTGKNKLFSILKEDHPYYKITAFQFFSRYLDEQTISRTLATLFTSTTLINLKNISLKDFLDCLQLSLKSQFCIFPEGINMVCSEISKRVPIHSGIEVKKITPETKHVILSTANEQLKFDYAVIATTPEDALHIYSSSRPIPALQKAKYISIIRLSFLVPLHPFQKAPFVLYPSEESSIFGAYNCAEDSLREKRTHGEISSDVKGILSVCLRSDCSKEHFDKPDSFIYQLVRDELCRLSPIFRQENHRIENFFLKKWKNALCSLKPEQIEINNQFWKSRRTDRVYFCGDYLNPMWSEGSVCSALEVAKRITEDSESHLPRQQ